MKICVHFMKGFFTGMQIVCAISIVIAFPHNIALCAFDLALAVAIQFMKEEIGEYL